MKLRHRSLAFSICILCTVFFCACLSAVASGDSFSDATVISGSSFWSTVRLKDATREPGDPEPVAVFGWRGTTQSIWWRWRATDTGTLELSASLSAFLSKALGAFTGNELAILTNIGWASEDHSLTIDVRAGEIYQIALLTDTLQTGDAVLFGKFHPPPPNDTIDGALPVNGKLLNLVGSTAGARYETAPPALNDLLRDVWFQWESPEDGRVMVEQRPGSGAGVGIYIVDGSGNLQGVYSMFPVKARQKVLFRVYQMPNSFASVFDFRAGLDTTHISSEPKFPVYPESVALRLVQDADFGSPKRVSFTIVSPFVISFTSQTVILTDAPWETKLSLSPGSHRVTCTVEYEADTAVFESEVQVRAQNNSPTDALAIAPEGGRFEIAGFGSGPLWWRWTAPLNGYAAFGMNLCAVELFEAGSSVAVNPLPAQPGWFPVKAGTEYRILVRSDNPHYSEYPPALSLSVFESLSNDSFNSPQLLPTSGEIWVDLDHATIEPDEPRESGYGPFPITQSLWYRWIAPAPGRLSLRIQDPEEIMQVAGYGVPKAETRLFKGSTITSLALVPSSPGLSDPITVEMAAGEELLIRLNPLRPGLCLLKIGFDSKALNDQFSLRSTISSIPYSERITTLFGGTEAGEAEAGPGWKTFWWDWTAAFSGTVACTGDSFAFFYSFPSAETVINVFRGGDVANLSSVIGKTNAWGTFIFDAVKGETYQIRLATRYNDYATLALATAPPENDNRINAISLVFPPQPVLGTLFGSTYEAGESPNNTVGNLWWKWTAPTNGTLVLNGSEKRVISDVTIPGLVSSDGSRAYRLEAGRTYLFEADGYKSGRTATDYVRSTGFSYFFHTLQLFGITNNSVIPARGNIQGELRYAHSAFEQKLFTSAVFLQNAQHSADRRVVTKRGEPPYAFILTNMPPGNYGLYAVAVTASGQEVQTPAISVTVLEENDNVANALVIQTGRTAGNLRNSSLEQNEPNHFLTNVTKSLWYRWTAPGNESVQVIGQGTFSLFKTGSAGDLKYLSAGTNLVFQVERDATYLIAALATADTPDLSFFFDIVRAPANDSFAQALPTRFVDDSLYADFLLSSIEPGEQRAGGENSSLWWNWAGIENGFLSISGDIQSAQVYKGDSLVSLQLLPVSQIGETNAALRVTQGTTYRIRLFPTNEAQIKASVKLTFTPDLPGNDNFTMATELIGSALFSADLRRATAETGEPPGDYGAFAGSLWYRWIATNTGPVFVLIQGDATPHLFSGETLLDLRRLESPPPESVFDRRIYRWQVEAGKAYYLRILRSATYQTSEFTCEIFVPDQWPIENDDFINAKIIEGDSFSAKGRNIGATIELNTSFPWYVGDLWWKWTAPRDGLALIRTSPETAVNVHFATTLALTNPTVGISNGNASAFRVKANQELRIGVYAPSTTFNWNLELLPIAPNDTRESALPLSPEGGTVYADFDHAPGTFGPESPGRSLLWLWTPALGGSVVAHFEKDDETQRFGLWAVDDPSYIVRTNVFAGRTYLLFLNGRTSGPVQLELKVPDWAASASLDPNTGNVRLQWTSPSEGVARVDRSVDLKNWTPSEIVRANSPRDLETPSDPFQFYRVIPLR